MNPCRYDLNCSFRGAAPDLWRSGGSGFPRRVNSRRSSQSSETHARRPQVEWARRLFSARSPWQDPAPMFAGPQECASPSAKPTLWLPVCLSIIANRLKQQSESLHSFRHGWELISPTSSESYPPPVLISKEEKYHLTLFLWGFSAFLWPFLGFRKIVAAATVALTLEFDLFKLIPILKKSIFCCRIWVSVSV